MNKFSTNSIANYFILALFISLHPFAEWPDANTYFERDYIFVNINLQFFVYQFPFI